MRLSLICIAQLSYCGLQAITELSERASVDPEGGYKEHRLPICPGFSFWQPAMGQDLMIGQNIFSMRKSHKSCMINNFKQVA